MPPFPPDLSQPIDDQADMYWSWLRAGCPYYGKPDDHMRDLIDACTSTNRVRLGALSGHPSEWVRLGVAGNLSSPAWAMWGDGMSSFGLAEDGSPWVSAAVLLRYPRPPTEIVESVRASTMLQATPA